MKTKKVSFAVNIVLIFSSIIGNGCSQQENEIKVLLKDDSSTYKNMIDRNVKIADELSTLINFNESLLSNRVQTRGWFGTLAATVSADVLGAYGGFKASVGAAAIITAASGGTAGPAAGVAVIGATAFIAGGASYGTYKGLSGGCSITIPFPQRITKCRTNQSLMLLEESSPTSIDCNTFIYTNDAYTYVGEMHNEILKNMLEADLVYETSGPPVEATRGNSDTTTSTSNNITDSYISCNKDIFYSEEQLVDLYTKVNNQIQSYANNGYDYDTTISELSKQGLTTKDTEDILRLYLDMLFQYVTNINDLQTVSDEYKKIVVDSKNLSIEDKNAILIAINTAINSMELWEN